MSAISDLRLMVRDDHAVERLSGQILDASGAAARTRSEVDAARLRLT